MPWLADEDLSDHRSLGELGVTPGQLVRWVLPYFGAHRRALLSAAVLMLAVVCLHLTAPLLLGQLIDLARAAGGAGIEPWGLVPVPPTRAGLLQLAGLFVLVIGVGFLLEARLGFIMARVGVSVVLQLKEDLFRHVLRLDPGFHGEYTPGQLIARVESDTQALKMLFSTTGQMMVRSILTFLGIIGVMLWREPRTALLLVPLLGLLGVASFLFVRVVRRYFLRSRQALARMTAHVTETIGGIQVLQHHRATSLASQGLRDLNVERYRAETTAGFWNYGFLGVFSAAEVAAAALVIAACTGRVLDGTLTLGTLVAFLDYLRRIFMPVQMLSEFVSHLQQGAVAAGRILGILERPPAHPEDPAALQTVSFQEQVRLEGVSFGYRPGVEVLHDVSFSIPRGQRVALVGPSGGGKSTLVKLLLRFHEPTRGRLTVDGVDLASCTRAAWRRHVGLVLQEVYLFPGTLGQNLTLFDPGADPAAVQLALQTVGAGTLVAQREHGLDTKLAERGQNLSLGERQLLSMTRALVHQPELLVLDEATSAVDPRTEEQLQRSMEQALAGRTALIVAHRLSTVRRCHQILVVQEGRIVERGTHEELWARPGGVYRALARLQLAEGPP